MRLLRFIRDFEWPELIDRENCVLCQVWGLRSFKASDAPILASNEQADAAIKAGAAIDVSNLSAIDANMGKVAAGTLK